MQFSRMKQNRYFDQHIWFSDQHTQMNLLFKQCGAGRENETCIRLKLEKKHYTLKNVGLF